MTPINLSDNFIILYENTSILVLNNYWLIIDLLCTFTYAKITFFFQVIKTDQHKSKNKPNIYIKL